MACAALLMIIVSVLLFHAVPPTKNHCDVDSSAYLNAVSLFERDGDFKQLGRVPYFGLGYPLFLCAVRALGGPTIGWLVFVQVLFIMFMAWLAMLVTRRIAGQRAGSVAAVLALLNIGFIVFAQFVLTDLLLSFFLLLFVERFTAYLENNNIGTLAAAGLVLGISCWIKLAALLFIWPLLFFVGVRGFAAQPRQLLPVLALAGAFFLPIVSLQGYNFHLFQRFELGSLARVNLLYWFYPNFRAQLHGSNHNEERRILHTRYTQESAMQALRSDVAAHPVLAVYVWLKNTIKTAMGLYSANLKLLIDPAYTSGCLSFFRLDGSLWQRIVGYITGSTSISWLPWMCWGELIFLLLRYLVIIPALIFVARARGMWWVVFMVGFIGYFLLITGHDGTARFRMMVEGMLVILNAVGLLALTNADKGGLWKT